MNPLRLQSARSSAEFAAISITFDQCCQDVHIVDHSDELVLGTVDGDLSEVVLLHDLRDI